MYFQHQPAERRQKQKTVHGIKRSGNAMPGAMRGILDIFLWASSTIPGLRERKPCDEKMNGGNQPADMSMIHRRHSSLIVALPVCLKPLESVYRSAARMLAVQVDKKGHMKNQFPAPVARFFCAMARDRPVPALSIPYQRYRQR